MDELKNVSHTRMMKQDIQVSESTTIMSISWTEIQLKYLSLKTNLYTENNFWTKALIVAISSSKEYFAFSGNCPTVLLMLSVLNGIHASEGQA